MLVATDADEVFDQVDAALGSDAVGLVRVTSGQAVRAAVLDHDPDLVVLDLQIGAMGGVATCLDLRLEAGAERIPDQTVLLLLDRAVDVHIARQAEADGWLIKPLEPGRIRKAATALTNGESFTEQPAAAG